jgi:hypothetical protein
MKRRHSPDLAFLVLALCAISADANGPFVFLETQTITLANPNPYEDFGFSLDAKYGLFLAGAVNSEDDAGNDTGSAYVYRQTVDGTWNQIAQFMSEDARHNDAFGYSIDLDDEWAIVGAIGHDHVPSGEGAGYIFHCDDDTQWRQVNEFPAPLSTRNYGAHVGISGSLAIISGERRDLFQIPHGTVDVLQQSGANSWTLVQHLEPHSQINDVAIEGDTVFVGGFTSTRGSPTVYSVEVYENSESGVVHSASILPPITSVAFGSALAVDRDRLLVGASSESQHGAAYIFERDANGQWTNKAHLVPSDVDQRFLVGSEVALFGDLAYVNSWDQPNCICGGHVYVFQRNDVGAWVEIAKLTSPFSQGNFGYAITAVERQVLISSGVNAPGAIHVFSVVPEPSPLAPFAVLILCLASECRKLRRVARAKPAWRAAARKCVALSGLGFVCRWLSQGCAALRPGLSSFAPVGAPG